MSWFKRLFGIGDDVKLVDKSSWAYKCEHLGTVVASNEHEAFALNRAKRQLWLATPETAFQVNTGRSVGITLSQSVRSTQSGKRNARDRARLRRTVFGRFGASSVDGTFTRN
jgi:hypothetical protein